MEVSVFKVPHFLNCRVAAIGLISQPFFDDPYKEYLNFTDHEKHIVEEVKKLSKVDWFRSNEGSFANFASVPFAEILTVRGVAFTFNILDFDELLNSQT